MDLYYKKALNITLTRYNDFDWIVLRKKKTFFFYKNLFPMFSTWFFK